MCTCHADVDAKLESQNGRLATGFIFHRGGEAELCLLMQIEKIKKGSRKKPPHVIPTFCPFCGEKLCAEAA